MNSVRFRICFWQCSDVFEESPGEGVAGDLNEYGEPATADDITDLEIEMQANVYALN